MRIIYGLCTAVGLFALTSANISSNSDTTKTYIEETSKVQFVEGNESFIENSNEDLVNIVEGNISFEYEVPSITYEMQEAETIANVGLINKVGTQEFNQGEINRRNIDIAIGENKNDFIFSVIKPTIEVPEYPMTVNFEKINEFTYSPFYFNSDKLKITSNDKYVVYLYNSEDECVASVLSENGNVEINTTNLDNYYILIFNESDMESISMKLSVE